MKISAYSFVIACMAFLLSGTTAVAQHSFTNANQRLTIPNFHSGCPVTIVDWNNDGLDDIVRLNDGHIIYVEIQKTNHQYETRLLGDFGNGSGYAWAMAVADVDHNGYKDIVAGGSAAAIKILMVNNTGTGGTLVPLANSNFFMQNLTFGDFNNDGWIDLFICDDNAESHIYVNDGAGGLNPSGIINFDVSISDDSGNYGSVYTDFDNDGDLDLYIAKCRQSSSDPTDPRRIDVLFVNDGNGNYTESAAAYGVANGWQTWTASFGDIDNDGDLDLLATNHDFMSQIFENDGAGHYTDITLTTGFNIDITPIESVFEDFDNDGYLDILITGDDARFFHNNGNKTFTKVEGLFDNNDMESFAVGDLNHDGFTDIYASYANIYTNPTSINDVIWMNDGNSNHFLTFDLRGMFSNKGAIGARATVYSAALGTQIREIRAGESYGTMNTFMLHFGLGAQTAVDSVVIRWPSGITQTIINPPVDQFIKIIEGTCVSPLKVGVSRLGSQVLCPGQSVTVDAPGGYSYLWSDGSVTQSITANQLGEYGVTVTQAGNICEAISQTVRLVDGPDETPSIQLLTDTVLCNGQVAILSGPANLDSYLWSNNDTTQTSTITQTGVYTLTIQGLCHSYTSAPISVFVNNVTAPFATDVNLPSPGSTTLTATGNNVSWYDVPVGGNAIATGNVYVTPVINDSAVYYMQSTQTFGGGSNAVGMFAFSGTSLYSGNTTNAFTYFNVVSRCTLKSVKVYTDTPGPRRIELRDNQGTLIDSLTVNVTTLVPDSQIVNLNFELIPGTDYSISTSAAVNVLLPGLGGTQGPRLKRNAIDVAFPYTINNVLSITGNSSSNAFYYYFYDWQVENFSLTCESDRDSVHVRVDSQVGLNDLTISGISVYPNPANDKLFVETTSAMSTVSIFDQTGRLVLETTLTGKQNTISVSGFATGVYSLKIQSEKNTTTQKVVID